MSSHLFSDSQYLRIYYWLVMGKKLNLSAPKTFNEKIQWLKLYNKRDIYTVMVDKYSVKKYVSDIIGEQYIIPTLGVWDNVNEIEWDKLPNKFVLKTTHGGGGNGVVICKDKTRLDINNALKKLSNSLKIDMYKSLREWPYKNVVPRIIAEEFKSENDSAPNSDLSDYKFYCFNGQPTFCQVIRDRSTKETIDFYDMEWTHMPFYGLNIRAKNGLKEVPKPKCLSDMIKIAKKLSVNIPFSRIDLYVINDKIYFGEITFYPASGMGKFTPDEWNVRLGDMIILPRNC